ncbi:hypothetical protein MKW98_003713, partial [Papaver atlanticum]
MYRSHKGHVEVMAYMVREKGIPQKPLLAARRLMGWMYRSGVQSPMRSRDAAPIQTPPVVAPWCRDILSLATECQVILHGDF